MKLNISQLSKAKIALEIEQIGRLRYKLQTCAGFRATVPDQFCNADKRGREIITWISHMDFAAKQYEALSARQEGTGDWLLEKPEFQAWTTDSDGKHILWCPGIRK